MTSSAPHEPGRVFPVTLCVMTYNEAANIAACLKSVPFVGEKLVVDCGSTDATVDIAAQHGARVLHQPWLGFGRQRQFATAEASHDWILFLDADETLTPESVREFEQRLPGLLESDLAGAILRRSAYFMGAPMRWYRPMVGERIHRLYHRGRATWNDARVHEYLTFHGPVTEFRHALRHHMSPTLAHKELKLLAYSELKTRDWLDRGRRSQLWLCPLVFAATFFKDYVLRFGCLDGWRGYILAHLAANYAVYKRLRHYEMIVDPSSVEAGERVLKDHDLLR
jgi:glycosyltransferase involved in cell wall biosynthesis